jgi:hypothetical protein
MLTLAYVDGVCATTGQLHRVIFPGFSPRRILYISEQVKLLITGQAVRMDQRKLDRWLTARAILEAFVDGRWMTIKTRPKSKGQLAMLSPHADEIWEIRDIRPKPSLRILGSFAEKDVFIALAPYERSELGARDSTEWVTALQLYKLQWSWLFDGHRPMSGSFPNDYISNARNLD